MISCGIGNARLMYQNYILGDITKLTKKHASDFVILVIYYRTSIWTDKISSLTPRPWKVIDSIVHMLRWVTMGVELNTLRPRQNNRYFPDDVFKCVFWSENMKISLKISLEYVPKVPVNNIPALVQVMARRRPGGKPLSEPMMYMFTSMSYASAFVVAMRRTAYS